MKKTPQVFQDATATLLLDYRLHILWIYVSRKWALEYWEKKKLFLNTWCFQLYGGVSASIISLTSTSFTHLFLGKEEYLAWLVYLEQGFGHMLNHSVIISLGNSCQQETWLYSKTCCFTVPPIAGPIYLILTFRNRKTLSFFFFLI